MRTTHGLLALVAMAMLLAPVTPVQARAGASNAMMLVSDDQGTADQAPPVRPMTDDEKASAGCVVSAIASLGIVGVIGPTEFVMTVVGGLLVPSSTPVLIVGLISTIASMTCGLGATLTPVVLWGWRQFGTDARQSGMALADPVNGTVAWHQGGAGYAPGASGGNTIFVTQSPQTRP